MINQATDLQDAQDLTAGPSHRVSGVPAHHTTSYYSFYYGPSSRSPHQHHGHEAIGWVDHRDLPVGGRPVAGGDRRARNRR